MTPSMSSSRFDQKRSRPSVPSRWPSDIQYLRSQHYSPSIPSSVLSHIACPGKSANCTHSTPTAFGVVIRLIDAPSHPAFNQYGLFASRKIPPRSHIVDYHGEVHCDDRPNSDYDLTLYKARNRRNGTLNIGIDASRMGNEARFINDYRGITHKPNALFKDHRSACGELRMSVWSGSQGIAKGEEILVSYGKGWWKARLFTNDKDGGKKDCTSDPLVKELESL